MVIMAVFVADDGSGKDSGVPCVSVIRYPSIVGCATFVPSKKVALAAPPNEEVTLAVIPSGKVIVNP
jgi:hypothetical protein